MNGVCPACQDNGTVDGCSECGYRDTSDNDAYAAKLATIPYDVEILGAFEVCQPMISASTTAHSRSI